MSDNAAIYFAADGFDPAKGLNGRRMAGESFIRGFFRHAQADRLVCHSFAGDYAQFEAIAAEERPDLPRTHVPRQSPQDIASVGALFYPGPNFAGETWMRAAYGASSWSICGLTHTLSTRAVMQGFFDLRMSDQREWDAVICTSRAAQSALLEQFAMADDHIRSRFRANPPPLPQVPVIPLGVDAAAFAPDAAGGAALRAQIGAGEGDVVFATVARLSPLEKFDPIPLFAALADAARRVPERLHLVLCGNYADEHAARLFEQGAAQIMPDVGFHVFEKAGSDVRLNVLSAADAYVFAIDNVQETFGLAPVEAMSAGLPLIVSDWDGLRDTVTPDVGIRIPTRTLGAGQSVTEARRFLSGIDVHTQYCGLLASMTAIDVAAMADAMVLLATDAELRHRMGAAAKARAHRVYDWSHVVPQMQELWAELGRRRRSVAAAAPMHPVPTAPPPFTIFQSFPTRQGGIEGGVFVADAQDAAAVYALHRVAKGRRFIAEEGDVVAAHAAILAAGVSGLDMAGVAAAIGKPPRPVERVLIWLLKYGLVRQLR